jgi:hypothetical protein
MQSGRINPHCAPTPSKPTPPPELAHHRRAPPPAPRARCVRRTEVRHRCAQQDPWRLVPPLRHPPAPQHQPPCGPVPRLVHHSRQAHRNDDHRHCGRHDHHHPGQHLAPVPSVVRHGSTSSGPHPVRRVDGEVVLGRVGPERQASSPLSASSSSSALTSAIEAT